MGKQSRRRSAAGQSPAGHSSISSSVSPTPAVRASSEPQQQHKQSRARELFWSFVRSSFCAFGYLFYIRYNNGKNTAKVSTCSRAILCPACRRPNMHLLLMLVPSESAYTGHHCTPQPQLARQHYHSSNQQTKVKHNLVPCGPMYSTSLV
jgi:hypothetical protein